MINTLKHRLNDMHIFTKLFLFCLAICFSIALISGVIVYNIASDIILDKTVTQAKETVRQISENYDTFMTMIYNKLDILAFNTAVQEELRLGKSEDSEEGYYSKTRKLKRQMVMIYNSVYMKDLEIYGDNGKNYFCATMYQEPKLDNEEELKALAKSRRGAIVCVNDIQNSGDIQLVKEIKDLLSMEPLGVMRNAIRLSSLENIQKNVDFAFSGSILLLDNQNKIICGEESKLLENADELFQAGNGSFISQIDGEEYEILYHTVAKTGWKTIGIISRKEINKSVTPLLIGIGAAMGVGLLLGLLLCVMLSGVLVRPLHNTSRALRAFASGDFSVSLDETRKDEFGEMNHVFNETIRQVEQLLEEISNSRLLSKEMEIKALQAQINPHFLYNALDTVNWMARIKGEDEICEMVQAIGNLLRISISNKENIFTVRKELDYVKDYLYIQKKRFQNRFTVEFDVEEAVMEQLIPKLTIQPLVENAIVHSVEVSKAKVLLVISGHIEGADVVLRVKDNGVGIPKEILEHLLTRSGNDGKEVDVRRAHTGLGVYAVHQRLQYMYGEPYGLMVESEVGKGTCFTVRLPHQIKNQKQAEGRDV